MTKRENGDKMNIVNIIVREYEKRDVTAMAVLWKEVVEAGNAFQQMDRLTEKEAGEFWRAAGIYPTPAVRRHRMPDACGSGKTVCS